MGGPKIRVMLGWVLRMVSPAGVRRGRLREAQWAVGLLVEQFL